MNGHSPEANAGVDPAEVTRRIIEFDRFVFGPDILIVDLSPDIPQFSPSPELEA